MPTDWYTPRSLFNFRWRASRREYFLIQILGLLAIYLPATLTIDIPRNSLDGYAGSGQSLLALLFLTLEVVIWIAAFIVILAVSVRRMHDQEKSGWLLLLNAIPLIGWIFSLIFIFTPGDVEENLYGPNPRHEPRPGSMRTDDLEQVFD